MAKKIDGKKMIRNVADDFNRAPVRPAPAVSGRKIGTSIPVARGVQGMAPGVDGKAAQTFLRAPVKTPPPVTGRRTGTSIPPSRGIQELSARSLPEPALRNIELQPSAPTAVNATPRTSRVARGMIGAGVRLNALGFAAGLPMAIQREAEYHRELKRKK